MLLLDFYGKSGKSEIEKIERGDLEAFIEHEQDRGIRISTVRTRLACIIAFLHSLMEQDVIQGSLLKRRIRLKLPDTLPRVGDIETGPKTDILGQASLRIRTDPCANFPA